MLSPGFKSLGNFTITTADTVVGDWVEDLEGMTSFLANLRLAYGSGGTTIKAYIQGSADQGNTAYDIACVLFGTASEVSMQNFTANTPKLTQVTPSDGALADDTALDGLIPDRLRIKVVSTGTYAGSTLLSASAIVR